MNESIAKELASFRVELLAEIKDLFTQTTQPVAQGELLTAQEAADLAGISRQTLFVLRAKDDFPAGVKSGVGSRKKKWRRKDVLRWVENRKPPRRKVAEEVV